jgi:hypothetical protein
VSVRAKTAAAEYVMATRLVNSRDVAINLYLEPWGEVYAMAPGALIELTARGPEGDALEVALTDDGITVWGWPGSTLTISHDGAELGGGAGPRSRVPDMPPLVHAPVGASKHKKVVG